MADVYTNLIIEGRLTFARVPDRLKEDVRRKLIERDHEELITD